MRQFKTLCKDTKTGLEMILSEVSFNKAADFLSRKFEVGEFIGIAKQTDGLVKLFFKNRNFYYDEERGYLLGE